MDATEIAGIEECLAAGLRFAWIDGQMSVTGPRDALQRAAAWLREHREFLRQRLLDQPHLFAEDTWPASESQAAIWAAFRLKPDMAAYNLMFGLRAPQSLEIDVLKRALRQLLQRHDALRTALDDATGSLQATLLPVRLNCLHVINLAVDTTLTKAETLCARVDSFGDHAFELRHDTLLRVLVLKNADPFQQRALGFSRVDAEPRDLVFLVCHHAAVDFWGLQLLLQDFDRLYRQPGEGSATAPAPRYRAFSEWQQRYLSSPDGRADEMFWQQHWSAPLPEDAPWQFSARAPSFQGQRHQHTLSVELTAQIRAFAKAKETTPFIVLLTAFALLQARYTQQREAIIGSPVAGRSSPEAENTVGHFVNLLTMRLPVANEDAAALLKATAQQWLDALSHADYPFSRAVAGLHATHGAAALRIPPAVMVWHQASEEWITRILGGDQALVRSADDVWPGSGQRGAAYPLVLAVLDQGDNYRLEWTHDPALYDHEAVSRRANDFLALLAPLLALSVTPADTWLLRQPAVLAGSAAPLKHAGNGEPETLWSRIERAAGKTPDQVALVDAALGTRLSHAEFADSAKRIAAHMHAHGIAAGDRVGLWVSRSVEWPLACAACWYLGVAFVPLDRQAPLQRLQGIIDDAGLRHVLTDGTVKWALGDHVNAIDMCVTSGVPSSALPAANLDATLPAYVLYTSGSTGRPKGVQIAHRHLLHYSDGFETLCQQSASAVCTHSPYTFDASIYEVAGALLHARTLVIMPDLLTLDRHAWFALLFRQPIDMLYVPPLLLDPLREAWAASGQPWPARLMTGVEPIAWRTLHAWLAERNEMDVINQYGPTETTVAVTGYRVTLADGQQDTSARVPLGLPMPGISILLQDQHGRLVARGEPGEAVITGGQVGDGYIGHAATKPNGFHHDAEGRWCFRTGDWMRIDDNGHLVYLGRADHQVKLRGVRVELGEVRAALLALPEVHAAWIEARRHASGTPFLVAHVVADMAASALLDVLRQSLPPLLLPSHIERHDALPLNRHGKVDAQALAQIPLTIADGEGRLPESHEEWTLWNAWCAELAEPPRHVRDNFFFCGGHSLVAARIASRVHEAGYTVSVADLLQHTDIEAQSRCLRKRADNPARLPRHPENLVTLSAPILPFHFTLWAHEAMQGPSRAYIVPMVVRVPMALEPENVRQQWRDLARIHEALRTRFVECDAGVVQQVLKEIPLPLHFATARVGDDDPQALDGLIASCLDAPLSMHGGEPLWRVHCIALSSPDIDRPASTLVVALFHHAIFDGSSVSALWRSWQALATGFHMPEALGMVDATQAVMQPPHDADGLAFWYDALASCEPMDWVRPVVSPACGELVRDLGRTRRGLPNAVRDQLQQVARQLGTSPFTVAFCAFQVVCARLCGHLQAAIAIPVDLREPAFRDVVGGLVNTLSVPCRFAWSSSLADAIRETHAFLRASQPHRYTSLDRITTELGGNRAQWQDTLFGAIFVWEGDDALPTPPGVDVLRVSPPEPKTDLELVVTTEHIELLWRHGRFESVTVSAIIDAYSHVLAGLSTHLDTPVSHVPLMSEPCWLAQVNALNGEQPFTPVVDCVLSLLQRQVALQPDAIAVRYWQHEITYATLITQVRRYSEALRASGVGVGDRVAFALPRVPETIAALLAIWHAGAAYVPIDLRWPADRQQQVIAASEARCLLYCPERSDHLAENSPIITLTLAQLERCPGLADSAQLTSLGQTAYILFTSGSTGTPKGVVISHHNLAAFLRWTQDFYPREDFTGLLAVTTFAFDISVFEVFATLVNGGTVCLVDDPLSLLDPALREAYHGKLTFLSSVPSVAAAWLDAGVIPAGIRTVNMGGELLPQSIVERWYAAGVGRVLDLWGPTEDTTYSMVETRTPGRTQSIGQPIRDTQMWVLDARLQPLPRGIKGELVVGGHGLSEGYLNAPELTARVFVENPHAARYGHWAARFYRSGDVGWQGGDDRLHYCGRADFQVKIRGQRIELSEIEARLRCHPSVRTALVLVLDGGTPHARLLACVEPVPGHDLDEALLAAFVSASLPSYMVPAQWHSIERWPLNPNGKIDRRKLAETVALLPMINNADPVDAIPLTAVEETLGELFLQHAPGLALSFTRTFDQCGLDSIALLKFSFAVKERLGLSRPLPLSVWLQHRNLRALGRYLSGENMLSTWTRLNEAPSDAPVLACVHAVGGEITGFRTLARHLSPHWQVWAVALPETIDDVTSLAALAKRYADAWGEISSKKVVLAGYSLGGLIASQMVPQLTKQGVTVDRLLLLDTFTPDVLASHPLIVGYLQMADSEAPAFDVLYQLAVAAGWLPSGLPLADMQARLERIAQLLRIALASELSTLSIAVTHLASAADAHAARQSWSAWLAGPVRWADTRAAHANILDERYIDAVISALTDNAQAPAVARQGASLALEDITP